MSCVIKSFASGKSQYRRSCCFHRTVSTSSKANAPAASTHRFQQAFNTKLWIGILVLLAVSLEKVACTPEQEDISYLSDDSPSTKAWNVTNLDRLRLQLFNNYDKNSHPTKHGAPTNVSIGISINYVDIDELSGKVTVHSWLRISWTDENRTWNSSEYGKINQVHLRPKEIWKPDITLFNSAGDKGDYVGDTQILVSSDGSFLWVPPAVYTTYCNLNLLLWPYDMQTCKLKVGTWTLTYLDADYAEGRDSFDFDDMVQSTEWEIVEGSARYVNKDYYNYVEFTIKLQRRSSMYAAVIFTPASCIILLALSTFWLPPQMGEKILLNGIIIVVITAFLMYFAQLLPILAENTPLVVAFYSCSLLLLSFSTIIAVLVLYLSTAKHKRRLPDFIKNLLNGTMGKVLLLSNFTLEAEQQTIMNGGGSKELGEHIYESADSNDTPDPLGVNPIATPSNRSIQFDWVLLATAVDRIFFLFYCLMFIILAIVFSV